MTEREKHQGRGHVEEPSRQESPAGNSRLAGLVGRCRWSVRLRVLAPVMLLVLLLMGLFGVNSYRLKRAHLERESAEAFRQTLLAYQDELEHEAHRLSTATEPLLRNAFLQEAFLRRDRQALLAQSAELFSTLRDEYRITHFYFHDPDRVNVLRVHQPDRNGDTIGRFTALGAESTGKPCSGIELGPLGTFTLRVVHPWRVDGKLIGYIELGEEIDHITRRVHEITGLEMFLFIQKRRLKRPSWEKGMAMLGREEDWDAHPTMAPIDATKADIPAEVMALVTAAPPAAGQTVDLESQGRLYCARSGSLEDVAGQPVGQIILLRDITAVEGAFTRAVWEISIVCVLLVGVAFVFFSVLLGRIDRQLAEDRHRLADANASLTREIADRKRIQRQIERAKREWERTFDAVPDMIAIIDDQHRLLRANRAMADQLGKPVIELIGRHCYKEMHKTDAPPEFCPLCSMIEDGQDHDCVFEDPVSGKHFWVTVRHIRDEAGERLGAVHVVRDVTSRVEFEARLQETIEQLERFNRLSMGREMRMIELKREVNRYAEQSGQEPPYDLSFTESTTDESFSHAVQETS
jgi:PAS domain S-box-containing protein